MPFTCRMRAGLGDAGERDSQCKREKMVHGYELNAVMDTTRATGCSSFLLPTSMGCTSDTPKESLRWYNHNSLKHLHR